MPAAHKPSHYPFGHHEVPPASASSAAPSSPAVRPPAHPCHEPFRSVGQRLHHPPPPPSLHPSTMLRLPRQVPQLPRIAFQVSRPREPHVLLPSVSQPVHRGRPASPSRSGRPR